MVAPDLQAWLGEDSYDEDVTSRSVIPEGARGVASLQTKQELVPAGVEHAASLLDTEDVEVRAEAGDGDRLKAGSTVLEAKGPAHALLARERTAVNVLAHLSGIATRTAEVVEQIQEAGLACDVLATRKTTPGLRVLEHEAVRAGGGRPHREDLSTSILVKENHLAFVSVDEAVQAAASNAPDAFLMVEAEDADEARAVARSGADGVLLDNFEPGGLGDLVDLLKRIDPSLTVEASGGITVENAVDYARHVDRVSLGSLTHSAPAADLSMRIEPA